MTDRFAPGDLVRVPFGDTFIDAYVERITPGGVWVRGSDEYEFSSGIFTFYIPENIEHSTEPKGPVSRWLPNAS